MTLARIGLVALLTGVLACAGVAAEEALKCDPVALRAGYDAHKTGPIPIISEMNWGIPVLLVYENGQAIFPLPRPKGPPQRTDTSGYLEANLTPAALAALVQQVSAVSAFWGLENNYKLSELSDESKHTIRIRLTGRPEKIVEVYGFLDPVAAGSSARFRLMPPPAAFLEMDGLLRNFRPEESHPWDPGFVEVLFYDYSHSRDPSLAWPENWPTLESPFSRKLDRPGSFLYRMIFPSDHVPELNAFLARRAAKGAILIEGAKFSVSRRWPFPGEKNWSTWNF